MSAPTIDPAIALATHRHLCAHGEHRPGLTILLDGTITREALRASGRMWVAPDVTEARWFAAEMPPAPGGDDRARLVLWRYEQSRRPVLGQLDAWEAAPCGWRRTADLEVLVRCHLLVAQSMPPGTVTPLDRA